jgi:phosphate transport system substrate-binding protein
MNPGASLPNAQISAVHRSDGSGTTFVFTNYLCTQSDDFQTKINSGKSVSWPGGQGGAQNVGVTQAVQKTAGAIGYIELNFAVKNNVPFALMLNESGKFVKASPESVSAAGEGALADMDKNHTLAVRLWTRQGENSYPISSFTYLICYKDLSYLKDRGKAQAIADFFWYASHDGQAKAAELAYAPLSGGVQQRVGQALEGIVFEGQALPHSGQ